MYAHAQNRPLNWKDGFNLFTLLAVMHQRALIIPVRDRFGKDIFRMPCLLALVLMCVWMVLSKDVGMGVWMVVWVIYYFKRKNEALNLDRKGEQIHSYYDGRPKDAMKFCSNERTAKMIVEPLQLGVLGSVMAWVYMESKMPVVGLPLFYMLGVFTLPIVEKIKQTIWDRRIQGMVNSRIEQEALMRDFKDRP